MLPSLAAGTGSLAARAFVAALAAFAAFACALVFEASVRTEIALKGAKVALFASDPAVRVEGLRTAARLLDTSWAQPLAWHAGANEAMSFIAAALGAETRDRAAERLAVLTAARCVEQSPIQPAAWTRLAAFAQARRPVGLCDARSCLDRSWRAAPIADSGIECARMRLEHRLGRLPPGDPRFDALDQSMMSTREFAQCLAFLPRAHLFDVLMKRAARNLPEDS
jgi:hypothetical protein